MNTASPGSSEASSSRSRRRQFLASLSLAGAGLSFGNPLSALAAEPAPSPAKRTPIYFFSKPLDAYETDFMADALAQAGLDGFDLTVRPNGKVNPERADQELPKFAEAIRAHKLAVKLMVTNITSAGTPHAEKVLAAAAAAGVSHYRLGYFEFDHAAGIRQSLQKHKATLQQIALLNQRHQIQAGYQNHAGTRVGSPVWDLEELFHELPVNLVSVQYDIRHAVTEGSSSWPIGLRLLRPHIGSLAFKDFTWDVSSRRPRVVSAPLGKGIVDFDAYFKLLKELNLQVPLSLHIEYPLLTGAEESLPLLEKQKIIVAKLKHDADFLRARL